MLAIWAVVAAAATTVCAASPWSTLPLKMKDQNGDAASFPDSSVFHDMFMALSDMQDTYFQRWVGTWPQGIDWTRAVMNTHVAAALRAISEELELRQPKEGFECATRKEEVIGGYFADVIAYYFGEDAFALRNQAYDDMLWVVLGWLESIQFVDEHSGFLSRMASRTAAGPGAETWYGSRWMPAFAHRARIFWELAAKGWDTKLCGGGMLWNPRLMPYKNAITNQLFISASIGMYLHFPGDPNTSPFDSSPGAKHSGHRHSTYEWRPHDPVLGKAAQDAHAWLTSSNMINAQGLYADGFHISGHSSGSNNTKCDERDEMVYTYNQGVILSGLLGLYQATGREHYLREGHALIENVIRATGYDLARNRPIDEDDDNLTSRHRPGRLPRWHGLGRAGVLEDACDVLGACSQDAQTFKGAWMHHFATFCAPAALRWVHPTAGLANEDDDDTVGGSSVDSVRAKHAAACRRYVPWLRHNARAALGTRDRRGLFGMWWTAGLLEFPGQEEVEEAVRLQEQQQEEGGGEADEEGEVVDYRNWGVPQNEVWMRLTDIPPPAEPSQGHSTQTQTAAQGSGQKPIRNSFGDDLHGGKNASSIPLGKREATESSRSEPWDPNLRGRGRTVETQGGGLALLRALWVVSRHEL